MTSLPIRWAVARAFAQATEDETRVAAALDAAVSGGTTAHERLTGQFGNPVVLLSRRIQNAEALRATWRRWAEAGIVETLRGDIEARLDEDGVLHFRLDKQQAYEGRLVLRREADAIDVQVKIKAYPASPEEIRKVARALVTEAI